MKANIDFFEQLRKEIEAQACATPESTSMDAHAEEAHTESESAKDTIQQLEEENRRLKEEVKRLREEIENCNSIPDEAEPLTMTTSDIVSAHEEMMRYEAAQQQIAELMQMVESQQDELRDRNDGVQRLPLIVFIEYAEENYTPEQNDKAAILKEVLYDVFSTFTEEEKKRLKKLGHKPQPQSSIDKIFEIKDNENVNLGMK